MPGPPPKDPNRRQRRNQPKLLRVVPGGLVGRTMPDPPKGLLKATRESWSTFFSSNQANLVELGTDMPALERLFQLYDERRRSYDAFKKKRLVMGSQGQPVLNPISKMIGECDKEIRSLEDRFGLTPKARLALGIAFGEAARTLDDMNRTLDEDDQVDDDGAAEDPRAIAQ